MNTFTIYWTPKRNLIMDDCRKADTLKAGMLEQVLENAIAWHDVPQKDLERVLTYIGYEFPNTLVWIEKEHYQGSFCHTEFVCAIQL